MSFNDDILARWPILRVQELLTGRSSASQITTGSVKLWKGRYVVLQCPIHPDSKPSCKFEVDKDYFRCWACGEHGNRLDLIRKVKGFPESMSSADVIAWLKAAERDPLLADVSLVPQNAPDPRFADGEWVRLENEHLAGVYDYVDLDHILRYQVLRFEGTLNGEPGKRFAQRRHARVGERIPVFEMQGSERVRVGDREATDRDWIYNLEGVSRIPYMLPELIESAQAQRAIFVFEGEPKAKIMRQLGFAATSNSEGTGFQYPDSWADYFAGTAAVFFVPDCDAVGRFAARMRARVLHAAAPEVGVLDLWPDRNDKFDIVDFVKELPRSSQAQRTKTVADLLSAAVAAFRRERDGGTAQ